MELTIYKKLKPNCFIFFLLDRSHYRRALRQLRKREYSDIIRLCTAEIDSNNPDYVVESLLLRATFYLLRGESNKAMDDFEKLLNMNGVDKRVGLTIELENLL